MLWLLGGIFGMMAPYWKTFYKLCDLKHEKGWRIQEGADTPDLFIELKKIGVVRKVKFYQFLPQFIISIMCVYTSVMYGDNINAAPFLFVIVIFALTTLLFYGAAALMDKMESEIISEDNDINLNYNRSRKNLWKNFWVISSIINTLYTVMLTVTMVTNLYFNNTLLWGSVVFTLLIILLIVILCKRQEKLNIFYHKGQSKSVMLDDESLWIGGMIYNNPNDKHVLVNKRIGIGSSINLATFWGKFTTVLCIILLCVMLPIICIWVIFIEFTPMKLTLDGNELVAEQLSVDYRISIDKIESLELINELPRHSKVSGTGMDNLEKGTFYIKNVGKCQFFLNPQNDYYMHFTVNGTEYYMSASDDQNTLEIYQEINE